MWGWPHCPLLHHSLLLDGRLLAANSQRRAEHRVHPEPDVDRELPGRSAQNNFGRSLINSLIVAGTTTILTLLFGIIGAYALARLKFRGKGAVLWLIMACSMFPLVVLLPPLLKMFSSTEPFTWFPYWINTYQSVIILGLSFGLPLAVESDSPSSSSRSSWSRRQWSMAARRGWPSAR